MMMAGPKPPDGQLLVVAVSCWWLRSVVGGCGQLLVVAVSCWWLRSVVGGCGQLLVVAVMDMHPEHRSGHPTNVTPCMLIPMPRPSAC
jgi:hypothetical protein